MANRYWVGGDGNWSSTSHWSASSGGASGASVPTSVDDVIINAASAATNIVLDVNGSCHNYTATGGTGIGSLTGTRTLSIYGSLDLTGALGGSGGILISTLQFLSSSAETLNGPTGFLDLVGTVTFNGTGSWQLLSNIGALGPAVFGPRMVLTQGTLDLNGFQVGVFSFTCSGAATRTLTFGSGIIDVVSGGTNTADFTGSNLTINVGIGKLRFHFLQSVDAASGTSLLKGGGNTFGTVEFYSKNATIQGANTFGTLKITPSDLFNRGLMGSQYNIQANQTVTGTLTVTGSSAVRRVVVAAQSFTVCGASYTITAAAISLTNVDFKGITAAGAASPFSGTSIGDRGHNSNITFTTPTTRYWVGNGGNWDDTAHWSTSSGGSTGASIPLPQDDVVFDANSFSSAGQTVTFNFLTMGKNISFAAVTNNPTLDLSSTSSDGGFSTVYTNIYGNLTLAAGMTLTSSVDLIFAGVSTMTFTTAAVTIGANLQVLACGGGVTMADNLLFGTNFKLKAWGGTFDANGFNVTTYGFDASTNGSFVANIVVNMGAGTWTILGSNKTWGVIPGSSGYTVTINASTSTISWQATGFSGLFYNKGAARSYNNLTISSANNFFEFIMDADLTFSNLTWAVATINNMEIFIDIDGVAATAAKLYVTNALTMKGDATHNVILEGAGSLFGVHDQVFLSAGSTDIEYVEVTGVHALGAIPFQDDPGGTDDGNNTNWCFSSDCRLPAYSTTLVSAIARTKQGLGAPAFIVGAQDENANYGLFRRTTDYFFALFQGPVMRYNHFFGGAEINDVLFFTPSNRGAENQLPFWH
jgi:hypothetical protein